MQINLSEEEWQSILESLLFASCSDVCGDWYKEDINNLLNIAKKIKQKFPDLLLKNVFIHNPTLSDEIQFTDTNTPDIIEFFPEVLKENIV